MQYRQFGSLFAAVVDAGEVCDNGTANGDTTCGEESTCAVPDPRTIDSDGDGIPEVVEEGDFTLQGGRGVGCHVGVTAQSGPAGALVLMLAFCLGIHRYRRN